MWKCYVKMVLTLAIMLLFLPLQAFASGDTVAGYVPQVPEGFATQWTPNVDIYYSSGGAAGVPVVAADSEQAYSAVTRFFGNTPYRTKIIIGSSQGEYEHIIGVGTLPDYSMGTGWGDGDTGTIVIKSPELVPNFQTVLTHELTHIATRDYISGYKYALPEWLSEGLAVYVSGDLPADKRNMIEDDCRQGKLSSIDGLDSVLTSSTDAEANITDVGTAYSQSGMLVEYISDKYGNQTLLNILDAFGPTGDLDSAFMSVIGKTPQQVNEDWQGGMKAELDIEDGKVLYQTVDGFIVNQHGVTMPNETVSFTALRNNSVVTGTVYRAMTNESGFYELNVTYGPLLVLSQKPEYGGFNQTITLDRNEAKFLNITLNGTALELRLAAEAKAKQDHDNQMYLVLAAFNMIAVAGCAIVVLRYKK
jgi:hypothetical protein